jgi:5'-phosphate synthase pdxT subunit
MLKFLQGEGLWEPLGEFCRSGRPVLGTCAGAILLARDVTPHQPSLGLIDVAVERNAHGRQVDSFEAPLLVPSLGAPLDAVFIRAPRIRTVGDAVDVLARLGDEPVLVRQGRVWAATFHPELTATDRLHRWFVDEITAGAARRSA